MLQFGAEFPKNNLRLLTVMSLCKTAHSADEANERPGYRPGPIRATAQSGIANCGPLFLTLPTILFTGQIFTDSSEQGLSIASNSSSAAGSSPSHLGQSGSLRITASA
jgi:hypothetical protein